jgi:hypothetical protein
VAQKTGVIVASVIFSASACCHAWAQETAAKSPACTKPDGFIGGPFVPNEVVAKEIYRAVASSISPKILPRYPIIVTSDEGDHWSVSQRGREPMPKPRPGEVIVQAGGGQLYMNIDKCTGAISGAAFNR